MCASIVHRLHRRQLRTRHPEQRRRGRLVGTAMRKRGKRVVYKLAAPRFFFIWPRLFFNITLTSFAPKKGWGMIVYAPRWSLASQC